MNDNTNQSTARQSRVLVHLDLDPATKKLLDEYCKRSKRSRNNAVSFIVDDWLLTYEEAEEQA